MKYKVTNKLEIEVKYKGIIFKPQETKILEEFPNSDRFNVEKINEELEEKKTERRKKKIKNVSTRPLERNS